MLHEELSIEVEDWNVITIAPVPGLIARFLNVNLNKLDFGQELRKLLLCNITEGTWVLSVQSEDRKPVGTPSGISPVQKRERQDVGKPSLPTYQLQGSLLP